MDGLVSAPARIPSLINPRTRTRTYDKPGGNIAEVIAAVSSALTPVGSIVPTIAETAPDSGWLMCNGQSVSKADFSDLYAAIGDKFGETETHFNLPDLRGRLIVGAGDVALLGLAGASQITLTEGQMPSHSHAATQPAHSHTTQSHTHSIQTLDKDLADVIGDSVILTGLDGGNALETIETEAKAGATDSVQPTVTVEPTGGGDPINILPPVIGANWIIRA